MNITTALKKAVLPVFSVILLLLLGGRLFMAVFGESNRTQKDAAAFIEHELLIPGDVLDADRLYLHASPDFRQTRSRSAVETDLATLEQRLGRIRGPVVQPVEWKFNKSVGSAPSTWTGTYLVRLYGSDARAELRLVVSRDYEKQRFLVDDLALTSVAGRTPGQADSPSPASQPRAPESPDSTDSPQTQPAPEEQPPSEPHPAPDGP